MFSKILEKIVEKSPHAENADGLAEAFAEIDAKERDFADKKEKIKEEHTHGARLTKHRFTI